MWRFRTKKEFIRDFGEDWENKINATWNHMGHMDHLLGWTPESKQDQDFIQGLFDGEIKSAYSLMNKITDKQMSWTYSVDMFIEASPQLEFNFL
jgi:hypothetical protein